MPRLLGRRIRIKVGSAAVGPFTLVKSMNSFDSTVQRQTTDIEVFDEETAETIPGGRVRRIAVRGYLVPGDAGQELLRDAEATDTIVYVQVLPDGGNTDALENVKGYVVPMRVGSFNHGAQTGAGQQTHGFDLLAAGDPVADGTGGYVV